MTDIEAALERIAARRPRIIDLSLDRVHAALSRLDHPQRALAPVFHVAGTNGKGSTIAFLRAILDAAGYSVHVYTSPHLVRFNERIVLAGEEISDAALIEALNAVDAAMGEDKLTYFETITCAAFYAFAQTPADFVLLEVGLGGRLDATNVLDAPLVASVAPVDLDHQQFLGDTISAIAAEKAGIFRRGRPAVIGRQAPDALAVLRQHAENIGATPYAMGAEWDAFPEQGRLVFQDEDGLLDLDPPRLAGAHQLDNAALAVASLRAAGLTIDARHLSRGLKQASWPARLQRLTQGPLVTLAHDALGEAPEIWLDGGHNPHAGRALARAIADMEDKDPRPLALIAGMQARKDAAGFLENFSGMAREVYAVAADHEGVASAHDVAAAALSVGLPATICDDAASAIALACRSRSAPKPRIVICGSLYLAGEILAENA